MSPEFLMLVDIVWIAIIVLVYFCIAIVVFTPSLYVIWFYLISRKVSLRSKGLLKTALMTLAVNLVLAYFLFHLGSEYILTQKLDESDALAETTLRNAIRSQENFRAVHGRYYSVGPIRGPYRDENGLTVEKDVILQVVPVWDKKMGKQAFEAHAVHVWGQSVLANTMDGKIERTPTELEQSAQLKAKLLRSVK